MMCPNCEGEGEVLVHKYAGHVSPDDDLEYCERCGGAGEVDDDDEYLIEQAMRLEEIHSND